MPTPALYALQRSGIPHEIVRHGPVRSAAEAAAARGLPLAALAKTIVVRRERGEYLLVLVPGDRQINWRKLRRRLGVRRLTLPDAGEAKAVTGYERGAITPLGLPLPVYADARLLSQPVITIGAGEHNVAIKIAPGPLLEYLQATVGSFTEPLAET